MQTRYTEHSPQVNIMPEPIARLNPGPLGRSMVATSGQQIESILAGE